MNKRQTKKFLRKGNCPKCMNDEKVQFIRVPGKTIQTQLRNLMKGNGIVCECSCVYKEIR